MSEPLTVNGLLLPRLLASLYEAGRWVHPGDAVLAAAIPFLQGPVDFLDLGTLSRIRIPPGARGYMTADRPCGETVREVRSSRSGVPVELPWLDADRAVYLAVARLEGDDLIVALDYRSDPDDPRVVATEWFGGGRGCEWRQAAASFTAFARALGLAPDADPSAAADRGGM
jgi:hypothetical protein